MTAIHHDDALDARPVLLVVEDDADIALMVRLSAEAHGWRVVHSPSARGACALLEQVQPAVILLDLNLEDGPALPAVPSLRQAAPDALLVASSGSRPADPSQFDQLLPKGYPLRELEQLLERARPDDAASPAAAPPAAAAGAVVDQVLASSRQRGGQLADQLEQVVGRLASSGARPGALLSEALRVAHQLAGTAAVVGLSNLSDVAREVEVLLDELALDDVQELLDLAERLREAAARPVDDGTVSHLRLASSPARRRILVVEDDADLARLVGDVLSRSGLQVEVVGTGREAVARVVDEDLPRIDVVVLDLDLPDLHGHAVLRSLAAEGRLRDTHVIVVSGQSSEQAQIASFDAGAFDHIAKPVSLPLLQRRVTRLAQL